jgi:hypothetical protein
MDLTTPEGFLQAIMQGQKIMAAELDAFIATNQREGQLHDFKSGKLTHATTKKEKEDGLQTIRDWTTAFANADGGVLLIGPEDAAPHTITGCTKIGNEAPDDWAQKALTGVTGLFSPAPRFQIVEHPPEGDVLLIATERAPQLIPSITAGKMTYHLRINASTVEVPEYLISDLVLGRRQRPVFEIRILSCAWQDDGDKLALNLRRLALALVIQNRSMVRADKGQVGVVGWTLREPLRNDHVLMYVDLQIPEVDVRGIGEWSPSLLVQRSANSPPIPPFEHLDVSLWSGTLWVPCFIQHGETGEPFAFCRFAAFVASETSAPTWFQIEVAIARGRTWDEVSTEHIETACYRVPRGVRPVISCTLGDKARAEFDRAKGMATFTPTGPAK